MTGTLADLINGVSVDAGVGIMTFDVINYWPEPIYFDVAQYSDAGSARAVQPAATVTVKNWTQSYYRRSTANANINCLNSSSGNCNTSKPAAVEHTQSSPINIVNLIRGARAWDITGATALPVAACTTCTVPQPTCSGCTATRFQIQAASSPSTPRRFRIVLVASKLADLNPGPAGTNSLLSIGSGQYVGHLGSTFNRCGAILKIEDPTRPGRVISRTCTRLDNYRTFYVLGNSNTSANSPDVRINVRNPGTVITTAVSPNARGFELPSRNTTRPEFQGDANWSTYESEVPPRP